MSSKLKTHIQEVETTKGIGYMISFPIVVKGTDSPNTLITKIDRQVQQSRQEIIEMIFAKMGIAVGWDN